MAIRNLFAHPAAALKAQPQEEPSKSRREAHVPLSILEGLESPFMNVRYSYNKAPNNAQQCEDGEGQERWPLQAMDRNNIPRKRFQVPKDCTPFVWSAAASPERDPYASLKLDDNMCQFYQNVLGVDSSKTNKQLRPKVDLLREKRRQCLVSIGYGSSEFNFVFRDFMGHLSLVLDSVKHYSWAIELVLPFLQTHKQNSNSKQAFVECTTVVRRLSGYQQQDQQLADALLAEVWSSLVVVVSQGGENRELADETVKQIVRYAPLENGEVIYKVIMMRHTAPNFFSVAKGPLRVFRAGLMEVLFERLASASTLSDKTELLKELASEANYSYKQEPLSWGRQEMCEKIGNKLDGGQLHKPVPQPSNSPAYKPTQESPISTPSLSQRIPRGRRFRTEHRRSGPHHASFRKLRHNESINERYQPLPSQQQARIPHSTHLPFLYPIHHKSINHQPHATLPDQPLGPAAARFHNAAQPNATATPGITKVQGFSKAALHQKYRNTRSHVSSTLNMTELKRRLEERSPIKLHGGEHSRNYHHKFRA